MSPVLTPHLALFYSLELPGRALPARIDRAGVRWVPGRRPGDSPEVLKDQTQQDIRGTVAPSDQRVCRRKPHRTSLDIYVFFLSFFFFRFSFGLSWAFFCCSFLPLSLFPLSPISVSPCSKRYFPNGICSATSSSLLMVIVPIPDSSMQDRRRFLAGIPRASARQPGGEAPRRSDGRGVAERSPWVDRTVGSDLEQALP